MFILVLIVSIFNALALVAFAFSSWKTNRHERYMQTACAGTSGAAPLVIDDEYRELFRKRNAARLRLVKRQFRDEIRELEKHELAQLVQEEK